MRASAARCSSRQTAERSAPTEPLSGGVSEKQRVVRGGIRIAAPRRRKRGPCPSTAARSWTASARGGSARFAGEKPPSGRGRRMEAPPQESRGQGYFLRTRAPWYWCQRRRHTSPREPRKWPRKITAINISIRGRGGVWAYVDAINIRIRATSSNSHQ